MASWLLACSEIHSIWRIKSHCAAKLQPKYGLVLLFCLESFMSLSFGSASVEDTMNFRWLCYLER